VLVGTGRRRGPGSELDPDSIHDAQLASEWHERLAGHLHTDGIKVDEFIDAAPFATAPWLMPDSATVGFGESNVGPILTELRSALWVTAPTEAGGTAQHAVLHPWIAGALTAALSLRDEDGRHPTYRSQYELLLQDCEIASDPARAAYCRLALSTSSFNITAIAAGFAATFDPMQHGEWVKQLELAARAPARFGRRLTSWELYELLAEGSAASVRTKAHRTVEIETAVRRLLTASWLDTDPFAVPDIENLRQTIHDEYSALAGLSLRSDVRELRIAAARALNRHF
jgi:hypothetical protein